MRVAVYCPARFRDLVEPAIGVAAEFHEKWPAFAKSVRRADTAVAVQEWLAEAPGAPELRALRSAHPWTRFVLVTRLEGENAIVAPNLADAIVWFRHARAELTKAVQAPWDSLRSRMARFIRRSVVCSKRTTAALLGAAGTDPPIRTVAAWARAVATTVRTLERWFARDFASGITPRFFLDAMVLLWALDAFPDASSWAALGNHADADPQMLKGTALRLIGACPGADSARLLRQSSHGRRQLSPALVGRTSLAEGLAALMRPRW